jgi:hypothetical protein
MRLVFFARLALLALPLVAVACEDSDMFAEKKVPLTGPRKELFPGGAVPGVNYAEPPAQPSNSNISVNTEVPKQLLTDEPAPPPQPEQPKTKNAQKNRAAPRSSARNAGPDDPWAGARSTD